MIHEVLNQSTQAIIFIGKYVNYQDIYHKDKKYVTGDKMVVLKQFKLKTDKAGFKKELKVLKKLKSLEIENNGGFPVIITAKLSEKVGEIMMSYSGRDIFEEFEIAQSLEDPTKHT